MALVALKCDLREDPRTIAALGKHGERPCEYEQVSQSCLLKKSTEKPA